MKPLVLRMRDHTGTKTEWFPRKVVSAWYKTLMCVMGIMSIDQEMPYLRENQRNMPKLGLIMVWVVLRFPRGRVSQ